MYNKPNLGVTQPPNLKVLSTGAPGGPHKGTDEKKLRLGSAQLNPRRSPTP